MKTNHKLAAAFPHRELINSLNESSTMEDLQKITQLSTDAKQALLDIAGEGYLASISCVSLDDLEELVKYDLVNTWFDDTGDQYIEIGAQL